MKHAIFLSALLLGNAFAETVRETATEIPLVQDVDVLVVGGTAGAVAAACSAKENGASVFLIAPRPYLGEEIAGKLRVTASETGDLSHPLIRKMFEKDGDRTTPLAVKKTLDDALVASKIPFLTGAAAVDVLKSEDGTVAGVVMANRNGRQAIRAKAIVDATERASVARFAGAKFKPFAPGSHTFLRNVISGEMPRGEGVVAKEQFGVYPVRAAMSAGGRTPSVAITGKVFECSISIPMKDNSARSFALAEQIARDRLFTKTQLAAADSLQFVPVDGLDGDAPAHLFVLSAMKDPALANAGLAAKNGDEIGKKAAEYARKRATPVFFESRQKRLQSSAENTAVFVGEHSSVLAPTLVNTQGRVELPEKELPVLAECDVFVAGAGTGGAPAAIAAARQGAKTIIADYLNSMGGVMTDGLIGWYCFGNRVGFTAEIDEALKAQGAVHEQGKSEWFRRTCREAGAEVWYGTLVSGVAKDGNKLTGVVVVMQDGTRGLVRCKTAIDATGNAVLPSLAGEETEWLNADELSVQGAGMTPRNLGARYTNTDIGFVDDNDAADLCYFALRSRSCIPEGTWDQAQGVNTRERRRLVGVHFVTPMDIYLHRTYPDVVVQPYSNFDTHGQTIHPLFFILDPGRKGITANLPYRCFLPKKLDGLLVIGLGMSAHRDAMPVLRMQPDVQNQGYVAGVASAMAVREGKTVRDIDIKALQRHLVEKKIVPPEVLSMKDNFPVPDAKIAAAVKSLAPDYGELPVVMADSARATPLLRKAFGDATGANKLVYAHVLAMLGDATGADTLVSKIKETGKWDAGWNFRGMDQFNRSVSLLDSYIIALGRCGAKQAIPALVEKASLLDAQNTYSHFRALSLAFERLGGDEARDALFRMLSLPGVAGHFIKPGDPIPGIPGYANKAGDAERTLSLRELCLARALYRLGDKDGKAKRVLEGYVADPRRIYANHARLVLEEKK